MAERQHRMKIKLVNKAKPASRRAILERRRLEYRRRIRAAIRATRQTLAFFQYNLRFSAAMFTVLLLITAGALVRAQDDSQTVRLQPTNCSGWDNASNAQQMDLLSDAELSKFYEANSAHVSGKHSAPTLKCGSFSLPAGFPQDSSIAGAQLQISMGVIGDLKSDDVLVLESSLDGSSWTRLDSFVLAEDMSNAIHGGYWQFPFPLLNRDNISGLQVRARHISVSGKKTTTVFIDGMAIAAQTQAKPKVENLFLPQDVVRIQDQELKTDEQPVINIQVEKPSSLSWLGLKGTRRTVDKATITAPDGQTVEASYDLVERMEGATKIQEFHIRTDKFVHAGKYTVSFTVHEGDKVTTVSRDFFWGVLVVNTEKSVYHPGETAKLSFGVLDDRGKTICDAEVNVTITSPQGDEKKLSTRDNSILRSKECGPITVTDVPDYSSEYDTSDEGDYKVTVEAITKNGTHKIEDSFHVQPVIPFDILRHGASRIWPWADYTMSFDITPQKNYRGVVQEFVPDSFVIVSTSNKGRTKVLPGRKVIEWQVDWQAGKKYTLSYRYNPPDVSPEIHLLGKMKIGTFEEFRYWQIASDATCTTTSGGNWRAAIWSGCGAAGYPVAGDAVVIASGHMVTIPAGESDAALSIQVNANGSATRNGLTFAASDSSLALTSSIVFRVPVNASDTMIAVDAGTLTGATTLLMGGSVTSGRDTIFRISTGSATFSGAISSLGAQAQNKLTFTGAAGAGTLTTTSLPANEVGGITFTCTTVCGKVILTNSTPYDLPTHAFYSLEIAGSSTVTTTADLSLGGNLTVPSGTFVVGVSFSLTVTGTTNITGTFNDGEGSTGTYTFTGDVTVNAGATWNLSTGNHATSFAGNLANSGTTFNNGTGTVSWTGTSKAMSGSGSMTFGGTVTIGSGLTMTNNNTGTTTFNAATNCLTGGDASSNYTAGTNSITKCASALMGTGTLTASASGNTIDYTGASPTCKGSGGTQTYITLKFSGSGTVTCDVTSLTVTNVVMGGTASWTLAAAFSLSGTLTVEGGTLITGGVAFTVTSTTSITSGTLTNTNNTGAKIYIGAVTLNGTGTLDGASTNIVFRGGITNTAGTVSITGLATFNTNSQALSGTISIASVTVTGVGLTLTNNGTLTVATALAGTGNFTNGATGTLNVNFTGAIGLAGTLTASASGNTVNYGAAGVQTVHDNTYHHLTLSGSGDKTMTTNTRTIAGNLTLSGSATATTNASGTTTVTGDVIINTGATLTVAVAFVVNGGDITGDGTLTYTGTPIIYLNGTGYLGGANAWTFYGLNLSTSGGTATTTATGDGAITITNVLTLTHYYDAGSNRDYYHYLNGGSKTWTLSGAGMPFVIGATFTPAASTFIYSYIGASAVTVTSGTYFNLSLQPASGTPTYTLTDGATYTVGGNFVMGSSANLVTPGTSTITMTGTASNTITGGGQTIYNLTIDPATAGTITLQTSDLTVSGALSVAASDTLAINSGRILTHSGASMTLAGTINGAGILEFTNTSSGPGTTGTLNAKVRYVGGCPSTTVDARTYGGDVEFYLNSPGAFSIDATLASGTYNFNANLYINAADVATIDLSGYSNNPTVNVAGDLDFIGVGAGREQIDTGTGIWTASGNVNFTDGAVTAQAGNTLVMNGSGKTLTSAGQGLSNLTLSGSITLANATHTVAGNFSMAGGTITAGSSTVSLVGTSNTITGGGNTLYNLTIDPSSAGTITLQTSDLTVSGALSVAASDTLAINSGRILTHSGASMTLAGTINGAGILEFTNASSGPGTSGTLNAKVRFSDGCGETTVDARTYGGDVEFYENSGVGMSVVSTMGSGTFNFNANLYVNAVDVASINLRGTDNNPIVNVTGNLDFLGAGSGLEIIQSGTGTWTVGGNVDFTDGTYTATSGNTLVMTGTNSNTLVGGGQTMYNLTINPATAGTITLQTSDLTVSNTLNIATGDALTIDTGRTLTHTGATLTLAGTINGPGRLTYKSTTTFPTGGILATGLILRFDTNGFSQTMSQRSDYQYVEIYNTGVMAGTVTMGTAGSQTISIANDLTVTSGSPDGTEFTGDIYGPAVNIGGNVTCVSSANPKTITTGAGTWTVSGNFDMTNCDGLTATAGNTLAMNGTGKTLTTNSFSLQKLSITEGSVTTVDYVIATDTFTIANKATLTQGADVNLVLLGDSVDIEDGGTFTKASGSGILILDGVTGHQIFKDLNTTKQDLGTVQIGQSPSTTTLESDMSTQNLNIHTTDTLNTNGWDVTVEHHVDCQGTCTLDLTDGGANSEGDGTIIDVGGNWTMSGTLTASTTSKVFFNSTAATNAHATVITGGQTFNDVEFKNAGAANDNYVISGNLIIAGTTTLTDGGLILSTNNPNVNTAKGVTIAADAYVTKGTGTWTFDGTTAATYTDSTATPQNLGTVVFNKTSGTPANDKVTVASSMTVDTADIQTGDTLDLGASNYILKLAKVGATATVLTVTGTLTPGTSTVQFSATNSGGNINVPVATYSSLKFSGAETYDLVGDLTVGNALTGSVTIDATSTLDATASNRNLAVGGSWENAGAFTAQAGTVTLNTGAAATVSGSTTFNNLTITHTAAKTVTFVHATTQTVSGTWTVTGSAGNLITLQRDDTSAWTINPTAASVDYANVSWSNSGLAICAMHSTDGLNNNANWTFSAGASCGVTISGHIYTDEIGTAYDCSADNLTVAIKVNGAGSSSGDCTLNTGAYSVSAVTVAAGNVVTVFLNGETPDAVTVTRAANSTSAITLDLYQNRVIVRDEDGTSLSNTNMDQYDNGDDADIPFSVTGTALTVNAGTKLLVWTNKTFTPGGTVLTTPASNAANPDGDVLIQSGATLAMAGNALSIGGDLTTTGSLTYDAGQTTTFTATGLGFTVEDGTSNFSNLTFNGSGGGWSMGSAATVSGDLVVTTGALSGTNNLTVNGSVSGGGTITLTGGTFLQRVAAAKDFGSTSNANDWTFSTLSFENSSGSDRIITFATGGSGKIIASSALNIGNAGDSNLTTINNNTNNRVIDANGTVTITSKGVLQASSAAAFTVAGNWTNNGDFTAGTGTVTLDGAAQQTVDGQLTGASDRFYNLTITNSSGANPETSPSVIFAASADTANNFRAETANTKLRFLATGTYTFNNIIFNGQATGTRVFLRSSSTGTLWDLNSAGTQTVSNTDVRDSNACPGDDIDATDGTNFDSTHNPCWYINSLTFSISDTTVGFGALSSAAARWANGATTGSAVATAAHTFAVATNAIGGYEVTYFGPTLTGPETIDSVTFTGDADGTPDSKQFAMSITTDGDATIPVAYRKASNNYSFVPSTTTTLMSEAGPTATETASVYYICNIASTTKPGAYSTNITYIATSTF